SGTSLLNWFVRRTLTITKLTSPSLVIGAKEQESALGDAAGPNVLVGQDISVSETACSGSLACHGISVRGAVRISGSSFTGLSIGGSLRYFTEPNTPGFMFGTGIASGIKIRGGRIAGSVSVTASVLGGARSGVPAVDLVGVTIDEDLSFWNDRHCED